MNPNQKKAIAKILAENKNESAEKLVELIHPLIMEYTASKLESTARDLGWFGAQGNLVNPDTAWAGVTACMGVLRTEATLLRAEQG